MTAVAACLIIGVINLILWAVLFLHFKSKVEPIEVALSRKVESSFQGIYSSTERLSQAISVKQMHTLVHNAWQLVAADSTAFADYLSADMRRRHGLMTLREAMYNIHFPQSAERLRHAKNR